jgi:hypothetical protein
MASRRTGTGLTGLQARVLLVVAHDTTALAWS